ncbi:MAG: MFS transporter [Bacilli bacterium]
MKNKSLVLRYALGMFALTLVGQLYHSFSYSYYVDKEALISLSLATISKVIFILVDGLNDVIFAYLSEKTKSKIGKRLPWILYAFPFFPLCVLLTYVINNTMNFSSSFFFMYYLLISILFENVSTILYINIGALFPLLFKNEEERSSASSCRHALEVIAIGICLVLTPILQEKIEYIGVCVIYGIIYIPLMLILLKGLKHDYSLDYKYKTKYSFKQTIKDFFFNKNIIIYHLSSSFVLAALSLLLTLYPMYARYTLKLKSFEQSILMGILFICCLFSLFIWNKIIKRIGHRKSYVLAYILFPIMLFSLFIPKNFIESIIIVVIFSPLCGGVLITPDLMSSEILDLDKKKNKVSREASFMSLGTLLQRVSIMISALFMSIIGSLFGYVDGGSPGDNPSLTFRIIVGVLLPLISLIGGILSVVYYKLSKSDINDS